MYVYIYIYSMYIYIYTYICIYIVCMYIYIYICVCRALHSAEHGNSNQNVEMGCYKLETAAGHWGPAKVVRWPFFLFKVLLLIFRPGKVT